MELRIIILGKIGVGKSTTGNVILGKKVFDANPKSERVTLKPATGKAFRFNKKISVVDTPGFFTSNFSENEEILNQITAHSVYGYNAIVLVLDFSTFNENEKMIEFLRETLPKESFENLIVVFTKLDGLDKNDEQLADVLGSYKTDKQIKQLLKLINDRYVSLYHHTSFDSEESERTAEKLIRKMNSLSKTSICFCLAHLSRDFKMQDSVPKQHAFSSFTNNDADDSSKWIDLFKNGFVAGIITGAILGLYFTVSLSGFIFAFVYSRKAFDDVKSKLPIANSGDYDVIPSKHAPPSEKEQLEESSDANELRLILIGKTGVGKSATGNSILGEVVFVSKTGAESVTKSVGFGAITRFGRRLVVVDTPGLCDTGRSDAEIYGEITRTLFLTSPGPHAFILIVKPDRYTEEDEYTVSLFRELFGPNFQKYLIILFTDKDRLEKDDVTIEEYVNTLPENSLKKMIRNSNNRFLTMDYSKRKLHKQEEDVKMLLNMVDEMNRENTIPYYETEYSGSTEKMFDDIIRKLEREKYSKDNTFSNYRDKARQMILDLFTGIAIKALLEVPISNLSSFVFKLINTIMSLV